MHTEKIIKVLIYKHLKSVPLLQNYLKKIYFDRYYLDYTHRSVSAYLCMTSRFYACSLTSNCQNRIFKNNTSYLTTSALRLP